MRGFEKTKLRNEFNKYKIMNYNIFQGNKQLQNVVAKGLGFEINQKHSSFTSEMYFETYFYLSKRFGEPKILDDYKDGGTWDFEIKHYTIRITLNSSWVSFIVFGEHRIRSEFNNSYWIKIKRERRRKEHFLITNLEDVSKRSDYETEQIQKLLDDFQLEKNIPDNITPDEFNEKFGDEFWFDRINKFNNGILGVKYEDYEKYGEYSNSKTRHALKTLEQFIHNMLTPIWVRDCPFNIKGRLSDDDAYYFDRYSGNLSINFKKVNLNYIG